VAPSSWGGLAKAQGSLVTSWLPSRGPLLTFDAVCRLVGASAGDLGDLPLAVITSIERASDQPDDSRAQRARGWFYRGWAQLQDELAKLFTDIIASAGAHNDLHTDGRACLGQGQHDLVDDGMRLCRAGRFVERVDDHVEPSATVGSDGLPYWWAYPERCQDGHPRGSGPRHRLLCKTGH
jgi:hypothetical protein